MKGTCKYEATLPLPLSKFETQNPKSNNSRSIAIIGNSWAANSSPLVFDECSQYFGDIHRTTYVGERCPLLK